MFDISFFELLVVGVVGLIVIGPERLPGTIRTCALWVGRVKRSLLETRQELEKQIGADDIRRELHNEQVMYNLEKMKDTRLELEEKIRKLGSGDYIGESSSSTPANAASTGEEHATHSVQPLPQPDHTQSSATAVPETTAVPQPPADTPPKH